MEFIEIIKICHDTLTDIEIKKIRKNVEKTSIMTRLKKNMKD